MLTGWELGLFWVGTALLLTAVLFVITVVAPRLRSTKVASEWERNYIYFGHLMHWDPKDLQKVLVEEDPVPVVTRNIVVMSKIAWQKHRRLQISMWLATFGTALVGLAAVMNS
ncbi:Pycsar system effector family protein [Pseudonocardia sediminis]|uniref:Pycsar system effector family protein n=1 Tax=Pseudonocardia sediminis TaxID=1397368 RepID=UPI002414F830|nr:Pycsar system effector family protein [Pseudonocardia sediminis]